MASEIIKRMVWPIIVSLTIFVITLVVPSLVKLYVDFKHDKSINHTNSLHQEVMTEVKLIQSDQRHMMRFLKIPIPKSR